MAFHAIALVPFGGSTIPHNIRVGGYKNVQSAQKALDKWCMEHRTKYGYVQRYGSAHPVYIKGV